MGREWWSGWGRDLDGGGWARTQGRRDHLYCNSGALRISLRAAPGARLTFSLYTVSSFVFHSSAFTCTYSYERPSSSSSLLYLFRTVCLSCSPTRRGFPFYALVKYFPWLCVLLFVRILLSGFSACRVAPETFSRAPLHSLRVVSFITETSDFFAVRFPSSLASFLRLSIS